MSTARRYSFIIYLYTLLYIQKKILSSAFGLGQFRYLLLLYILLRQTKLLFTSLLLITLLHQYAHRQCLQMIAKEYIKT